MKLGAELESGAWNCSATTPIEVQLLCNFLRFLLSFANVAQNPPIQEYCAKIVNTTIDVYETITTQLLPTPAKSHYTFNLRDLSKIFQGLSSVFALLSSVPSRLGLIRIGCFSYSYDCC